MRYQMTVDASNFTAMARELAGRLKASGVTFEQVLNAEAGSVITSAAKRTREAKVSAIKRAVSESIPRSSDNPRRKRSWYTPPGGGGVPVRRGWVIPDSRWAAYLDVKREEQKRRLESRGLARQAWLTIADQLKLQLNEQGLKQARRAKAVSGRTVRQRANGVRSASAEKHTITLLYGNPLGAYTGARFALQKAINGRVGFYQRNLRSGALSNVQQISAKYPGLQLGL